MDNHSIKKQLSAAYRYAYSGLAMNYYTFYEIMCEHSETTEIHKNYAPQFHKILKGFLEGEGNIEELDILRNQVTGAMEVIAAYMDCFQIYEYVLNRMERRFADETVPVASTEEFIQNLMLFLQKSEDSSMMTYRITQVMQQLPVRYTKQKFGSMLQDSLSIYIGSEKKSLDDIMYVLRTQGMVLLPENMEQGHEDVYQILKQLQAEDYSHMEKEQYLVCKQRIVYAGERLLQDVSDFMLLQDMVNDLYVLFLSASDAVIGLSNKQVLENIVKTVLDEFLNGNTSMVDDRITDMLLEVEGEQERAMDKYLSCQMPEPVSGDLMAAKLFKIDKLLSGSSFVKLEEELQTGETMDRLYLEQQVAEFCQELNQVFAVSTKPVVRAIMARLLSSLPIVFRSIDDLEAYVTGSLESCSDMAEREACIELLERTMEIEDALV